MSQALSPWHPPPTLGAGHYLQFLKFILPFFSLSIHVSVHTYQHIRV